MLQQLSVVAVPLALAVTAIAGPSRLANPGSNAQPGVFATVTTQLGATETPLAIAPLQAKALRYAVAPTGNEARFRVREQLVGVDFPNDAVGKTSQIAGAIVVGPDGKIVREGSSFTVDLTNLVSDNARRDNYVRRNTLVTDSFPKAVFVPTSAKGLPATLPATGETTFELVGDLTVRGVTRPVTWQVKATRAAAGAVTGSATTSFPFAEFGLTIPKVGRVLSVDDKITLEYDFNLVPEAAGK